MNKKELRLMHKRVWYKRWKELSDCLDSKGLGYDSKREVLYKFKSIIDDVNGFYSIAQSRYAEETLEFVLTESVEENYLLSNADNVRTY